MVVSFMRVYLQKKNAVPGPGMSSPGDDAIVLAPDPPLARALMPVGLQGICQPADHQFSIKI
jgi:hypothetical protein